MPQITLRMRLYPTEVQERVLNRYMGAARAVYNILLEYLDNQYHVYKQSEKDPIFKPKMSAFDLGKRLKHIRDDCKWLSWLKDMSMCSLRFSCAAVSVAYTRFFKRGSGYPKFKKRSDSGCFHIDCENWTRVQIRQHSESGKFSYLRLEQFEKLLGEDLTDQNRYLKVRFDDRVPLVDGQRQWPGRVSRVSFRRDPSGKWFVSFLCEVPCKRSNPTKKAVIGLDLGIKTQAVASDGHVLINERVFAGLHSKMVKWQRRMSRRKPARGQPPSNRYLYARRQYARVCEKIRCKREHAIHCFTTSVVRNNRIIVVEDLAVGNMLKNHKLAKALSDVSLARIRQQFEYKVVLDGVSTLIIADKWYPSTQLCSNCGYRPSKHLRLKLADRGWTCPVCSVVHDRDFNASKNLEALGYKYYTECMNAPGGYVITPPFSIPEDTVYGL